VIARSESLRIAKSASLAALIMLGLSFPIIAYHADMDLTRGLFLESRWPLALILTAGVFVLRALSELILLWRRRPQTSTKDEPKSYRFSPRAIRLTGYAGIGALIAFPLAAVFTLGPAGSLKWIDNYGIQILIYVMLGWGLNIVVGLAGLLDLGYVAFYAVGAYAYALFATHFGWSFWLSLPLCGLFAACFGIALGFPVLRLRGDYLAIVTLAFGEIIRVVAINWTALTNGDAGISLIPRITFFGVPFTKAKDGFASVFSLPFFPIERTIFLYYLILALALLTNLITMRLRRLPLGRVWEALREDEIACRSLGIDTVAAKLSAFAIGAFIAGIAGAFFAVRQGFVSPSSFGFVESASILAIVVLGGAGSQLGIVLASIVIIGGSEFLRELDVLQDYFGYTFDPTQYRMLFVGLGMAAMMNWRPRGLLPTRHPSLFLRTSKPVAKNFIAEGRG
jgi:branched-chain amino acid transport system permease protein